MITSYTNEELVDLARGILRAGSRQRAGLNHEGGAGSDAGDSLRLAAQSGVFVPDLQRGGLPLEELWFRMRHFDGFCRRQLLYGLMAAPDRWEPKPLWSLFWALVKAESEFFLRYVPYWSHEERLSGHLLSQMVERLAEFSPWWQALGGGPGFGVTYVDTATAGNEAHTGADFGLIVNGDFGGGEFFKVARFQAKKAWRGGKARIDLAQVAPLTENQRLGYYVFYHWFDAFNGSTPPSVQAATDFSDLAEEAEKNKPKDKLGKKTVVARGWDLASFIAFGLADPVSLHGAPAANAREAVRLVLGGRGTNLPPLSRFAVLSLGVAPMQIDVGDRAIVQPGSGGEPPFEDDGDLSE